MTKYDQFITKKFADYLFLFDLKKSQWENGARKVFPPTPLAEEAELML